MEVIVRLFAILSCHSISLVEGDLSLNDEKWKNNFWKVFKFEILNKLLQYTLKFLFLKKVNTEVTNLKADENHDRKREHSEEKSEFE